VQNLLNQNPVCITSVDMDVDCMTVMIEKVRSMKVQQKNLVACCLACLAIFYAGAALAQNNKGQIGTDQFWADFSKGLEWLPTSKSISAAPTPSHL
jgi:hypothetical protein